MNRAGTLLKALALALGAIALSSPTFAAGVNSHDYACPELQRLILSNRFIFINNPNFEDFIVVDASYCGGGGSAQLQRRSVPTTDTPECLVNYCTTHDIDGRMGGGGGM